MGIYGDAVSDQIKTSLPSRSVNFWQSLKTPACYISFARHLLAPCSLYAMNCLFKSSARDSSHHEEIFTEEVDHQLTSFDVHKYIETSVSLLKNPIMIGGAIAFIVTGDVCIFLLAVSGFSCQLFYQAYREYIEESNHPAISIMFVDSTGKEIENKQSLEKNLVKQGAELIPLCVDLATPLGLIEVNEAVKKAFPFTGEKVSEDQRALAMAEVNSIVTSSSKGNRLAFSSIRKLILYKSPEGMYLGSRCLSSFASLIQCYGINELFWIPEGLSRADQIFVEEILNFSFKENLSLKRIFAVCLKVFEDSPEIVLQYPQGKVNIDYLKERFFKRLQRQILSEERVFKRDRKCLNYPHYNAQISCIKNFNHLLKIFGLPVEVILEQGEQGKDFVEWVLNIAYLLNEKDLYTFLLASEQWLKGEYLKEDFLGFKMVSCQIYQSNYMAENVSMKSRRFSILFDLLLEQVSDASVSKGFEV